MNNTVDAVEGLALVLNADLRPSQDDSHAVAGDQNDANERHNRLSETA